MTSMTIWRFLDGKPGHENQSLGLIQALKRRASVEVFDVPVSSGRLGWLRSIAGRCPEGRDLPDPDLLLGAGRATQGPMLACRRRRGGRAIVLMRPSLPRTWFDLCVVPEHDGVPASAKVLVTRGVVNAARPAAEKDPDLGLILVGGPSVHYGWEPDALPAQVSRIVHDDPRNWVVATSRRTPPDTARALTEACGGHAQVLAPNDVPAGWLAEQLAIASTAWITEDSVSMLYEALTAGCACGVLPVPRRRSGRVSAGLDRLLQEGVVTHYDDWQRGDSLQPSQAPFDEAGRCAQWILDRWFAN